MTEPPQEATSSAESWSPSDVLLSIATGAAVLGGSLLVGGYGLLVVGFSGVCSDSPGACSGLPLFLVSVVVGVLWSVVLWIRHLVVEAGRRHRLALCSPLPLLLPVLVLLSLG